MSGIRPAFARRSLTASDARRATRAVLAGGVTGIGMALLVRLVAFPALSRAIRDGRMEWLVSLWGRRPGLVIAITLVATAVASLPVLLAAFWAARPRPGDDQPLLG